MSFKGIILGIENVLVSKDSADWFPEIAKLLKFLQLRGIQAVVLANRDWSMQNDVGAPKEKIDDVFTRLAYKFPWFISSRDGSIPQKPNAAAVEFVLNKMGWQASETLFVGNDDADMMTAVNGHLLFLNAQWYDASQIQGIKFSSPKDIARFIDVFCLRSHLWHYELHGQEANLYALGTYGTLEQKYRVISDDAREAAKFGRGHPDFWMKYLFSTVYLSGLKFDYVATYPSSSQGNMPSVMRGAVADFAKCFRKTYMPDLIVRHTAARKSAFARSAGGDVDHLNQLNTIHLTKLPLRKPDLRYKAPPLDSTKTVLVVDDFCTRGYSQEAARLFIKQTGAKTIGLSLLKTINRGYRELTTQAPPKFSPYEPVTFTSHNFTEHPYATSITDQTESEIETKLLKYDNWDWPSGI